MLIWKYQDQSGDSYVDSSIHPVVGRLLLQRGIKEREAIQCFLTPQYERDFFDPFLFRAMERVVERIGAARINEEKVGIFGDFDADGVTSSIILRDTLTALGLEVVLYLPHKIDEGHGLNLHTLDTFEKAGVKLFLTLDCGMMNHAEILEAKKRGLDAIIIDHHHVPEVLPEAFAIINPKLPNETYPFRDLCGAGTSFKVASALYQRFLPDQVEQLKWLLDVAAIGTVADVMPLLGENRAMVKYGLVVLSKTRRVGLQEMFAVGRIPHGEDSFFDAHTIAFQIAPRINAASRMAHPQLAHDLLWEADRVKARGLALELEAYNVARQKVSQETSQTVKRVAETKFQDKKFIFAVGPEYPLGVIGLVAGKIAREFGKPTCILQRGDKTSTGSFRSIPGLNIIEAIEASGELLEKFGGHEQAAGMTILNSNLEAFYEQFNAFIEKKLATITLEPELWIDLILEPTEITPKLARDLTQLAPFGEGNREPVFALQDITVVEARAVGKDGQHWKLKLKNGSEPKTFDAVGWSLVESFPGLHAGEHIDIAFELSENVWNGRTDLQLKLRDIRRLS